MKKIIIQRRYENWKHGEFSNVEVIPTTLDTLSSNAEKRSKISKAARCMIFLLIGSMILLGGCAKKYTTEITFDQFVFKVTTENTKLEEITEDEKAIFENEENLYKIYTIMNKSGFSDSFLISKEQTDTQIPLERLMQINIKKLETRLQGFKASSSSQIDIECGESTMTGYLQSFTFDSMTPKAKIYMNQYFFKDKNYLYIISSSTENSTNNKGFKTGIKNIQCPK